MILKTVERMFLRCRKCF